jgi:divalent metal cation (Fe/Co/Zn/Cd) transporter
MASGESRTTIIASRSQVEAEGTVEEIIDLVTMHLSPQDVLVNLKVRFRSDLSTAELGAAVDRLEQTLREKHPEIKRVFIEPAPVGGVAESRHGS